MFKQVLPDNAGKVLALLGKQKFIANFYLAGGTALALQLGHRRSIDLDFFTSHKFNPRNLSIENFAVKNETKGSVSGELTGVKISFFFYQHELLRETSSYQGIKLAHPVDIALMKITAIASRGSRKDFIDVYEVAREIIGLKELFELLPKKFQKIQYEPYHLIKGLAYFKEAEKEAMPDMLKEIDWEQAKEFFLSNSQKLLTNL